MLELKNLVFDAPVEEGSRETKRIIDDLSLVIPDDSFTVITGPNGGGKSTLAKLIMGIEHPTSGQILFDGQEISELTIAERAKMGIGYGFQQPARHGEAPRPGGLEGLGLGGPTLLHQQVPDHEAALQRLAQHDLALH